MSITINGSGTITGISAGGLPDGSVTAADIESTLDLSGKTVTLPSGTGGKVLQVVQGTTSTQVSTSSTSYTDTGLSASITPSSTSSKIVVIVSQTINVFMNNQPADILGYKLVRGSTDIYDSVPGATHGPNIGGYGMVWGMSINYLDSPSTTSSTTYKTQFKSRNSSGAVEANYDGSTASIILMEIGA